MILPQQISSLSMRFTIICAATPNVSAQNSHKKMTNKKVSSVTDVLPFGILFHRILLCHQPILFSELDSNDSIWMRLRSYCLNNYVSRSTAMCTACHHTPMFFLLPVSCFICLYFFSFVCLCVASFLLSFLAFQRVLVCYPAPLLVKININI